MLLSTPGLSCDHRYVLGKSSSLNSEMTLTIAYEKQCSNNSRIFKAILECALKQPSNNMLVDSVSKQNMIIMVQEKL